MSPYSRTAHLNDLDARARARLACKLIERRIVEASGCWTVKGAPLHSGHVQFTVGSPGQPPYFRVRAHVFAWEVFNDKPVPAGMVITHACDVPHCVNPLHLRAATQAENVQDSIQKGRHARWRKTGERLNGRRPKVPYRIAAETEGR